jgi:hypothetical protein
LTDELRFGLTHKQLANACPSVKTLRNWEFQLAGGCLATVINQINKDAKILMDRHKKKLENTLVTDHGNCEGVDHFVKMIIWSSYTKDGKHVLRHFNLDVNRGGHTTAAAANAIAKSIKALHLDGMDVEFTFICGDSGGGAKVQALLPELRDKVKILTADSDFMNCILHALNLSYENACKTSLGDQGMNKYTVFQMCYLAILMLKTVKKQTDLDTLKQYYDLTMTELLNNNDYQAGAGKNFIQAFEELVSNLDDSGDDVSGDDVKDDFNIDEILMKCPTNIKEPNFSRWGTVSSCAKIVLEHWLPIFYMAQNICTIEKNNSYLHTIATNLMQLMTARADPNQTSPTHYTSLRFIVGFGDYMFDNSMEWAKRHDPAFGANSYGHITRLVPEHLFVMKTQMDILTANDYTGWKTLPEFKGFIRALSGVSAMGDVSKGGFEFFEQMPKLFLERFQEQLNEHTSKWRSSETLPVIIAVQHPAISKAFLCWLFDEEESFPNSNVELEHHMINGEPIKINVAECLSWLT